MVLALKKNKDPMVSSAYRPICLLSVLGKLYERLILNRLVVELDERGVPHDAQHGFRKCRSTTSAMEAVVRAAKKDLSKFVAMVTFDVKNAFNTIGHDIILNRLSALGCSSYLFNIVNDYFRGRVITCC